MATPSRRRRSTAGVASPPRRRRRVAEEEPEEEEPTPPRRRRRAAAEEEEPAETTRRNRSGRSRSTRSYDDEDDPVSRPSMPKGFGGAAELRKQTGNSDFPTEMRITEDRQIIMFLDPEPFVVYNQHWFNNRKGKKSFVCPQTVGDECPLCDLLDDNPRTFGAFNVIIIPPEDPDPKKEIVTGEPVLQVITAAPRLLGVIESEAAVLEEKNLSLPDAYFAISKSGQQQQTSYKLNPIKERDLEEDFGVIPLEDEEVDEFVMEAYDEDTFPYRPTFDTLEEVAKEMMG